MNMGTIIFQLFSSSQSQGCQTNILNFHEYVINFNKKVPDLLEKQAKIAQ